jgi:hypothetical protein
VPPDFRAQQFWLSNRQPKFWRRSQVIENTHTLDAETVGFLSNEFETRLQVSRDMMMAMRKERSQIIEE